MQEEILVETLMELYLDTLKKCGMFLVDEDDDIIEYNIFEEFDIGAVSFLHIDSLIKLRNAGLINDEVLAKSDELRKLFIQLQNSNQYDIISVRNSKDWRKLLELSDEIKNMLLS